MGWIVTDISDSSKSAAPTNKKTGTENLARPQNTTGIRLKKKAGRKGASKKNKVQARPEDKSSPERVTIDKSSLDRFEWKPIQYPASMPFSDGAAGGFLELEELEDVDVIFQDSADGRSIHFEKSTRIPKEENTSLIEDEAFEEDSDSDIVDDEDLEALKAIEEFDKAIAGADIASNVSKSTISIPSDSAWTEFGLDDRIIQGLHDANFAKPTEIQRRVLKATKMDTVDVVGAAETGSGKTLAFGLPILNKLSSLVTDRKSQKNFSEGPKALILTPTRELAIQICDHLQHASKHLPIKIVSVIGGISVEKQQRLLRASPDIIIATPGRLWEFMSEGEEPLSLMRQTVQFLVLDEADRMIENGHYRELDAILEQISLSKSKNKVIVNQWGNDMSNFMDQTVQVESEETDALPLRQTFVFSATLGASVVHQTSDKRKNKKLAEEKTGLDALIAKIEFQKDKEPFVVDLTSDQILAKGVTETKIECLSEEKDYWLYYFLLRHPGRTIVFANSIDNIKRLSSLLAHLQLPVYPLHAKMQQRQRMKNLDRFKANDRAILIASDVAARGLDIPLVQHVIHYQLPRTVELFIHRSGRTARGEQKGLTLMICAPEDVASFRSICHVLKKKAKDIPEFPVDRSLLPQLKERIRLATELEKAQYQNHKKQSADAWLEHTAKAMDVELDETFVAKSCSPNFKAKPRLQEVKVLLKEALSRPIVPRVLSRRYPTSGISDSLVQTVLTNLHDQSKRSSILTADNQSALDLLRPSKRQKMTKKTD